jgi:hypothetical protein
MDLVNAVSVAASALGFAKTAGSTAVSLAVESKVREQVNESLVQVGKAQEALLTIQASLFGLQSENHALKDQLRELREEAQRRDQYRLVITTGGAAVLESTTEPKHFVCPACHASKGEYQVLQHYGNRSHVMCPSKSCDARYRVDVDRDAEDFHTARRGGY